MKTKLTQKNLDAARGEAVQKGKPFYVWDTDLSGFGAYVSPRGDVSFLVQKWAGGRGGKAVRFVLGKTKNGMNLSEARTLATQNIGDISKGVNPVVVRRSVREETRDRLNGTRVSEALGMYIPERANSRFKREKRRALQSAFETSGLLKTPVADVTKSDVRTMIARKVEEGKPAAARNLFAAIRPFFSFCVDQEIIAVSPVEKMVAPSPVASRDRLLSSDEIKALWQATSSQGDDSGFALLGTPFRPIPQTWCRFYRLLLLTGQRRDEVAGMKWEEIDLVAKVWTIPAERSKNGVAHIVHLSDEALAELSLMDVSHSVPSRGGDSLPSRGFVLPASKRRNVGTSGVSSAGSAGGSSLSPSAPKVTTQRGGHISGYSKMKTSLDNEMAGILERPLAPWRIHDLRRTLASGLAEMGYSTDVADRLLNHVSGSRSGVKGVYQRYEFHKERKEAIEAWGKRVSELTRNQQ